MGVNSEFPTAPAFADTMLPPPVAWDEGITVDEKLEKIKTFLDGQYVSLTKMQNSIASGWLVSTLRVLNLTADTIVADSVFTQDLWIGKDDSTPGSIGLIGTATQIKIIDENGTTRVLMGDLGAGATNWGVQFMNTAGTVIFEAADQVFIDGAVITDATIVNAKIVNSTIDGSTKLANSSVPNSKISSISADKITVAGTLTCTSTTTAINVTSSGVVTFSAGGDIVFKATASDSNFISFRTSANTEKGTIIYSPASDIFSINNANGSDLYIDATYGTGTRNLVLQSASTTTVSSTSGAQITIGANITLSPSSVTASAGNFRASADNTYSCGISSFRWSDIRSVLINGADYGFDNGVRLTEPDKVYSWADPKDGVLFMRGDVWMPFVWFHGDGQIQTTGFLVPDMAKNLAVSDALVSDLTNVVRQGMIQSGEYLSVNDEQVVSKRAAAMERYINGTRPISEAKEDQRRTDYKEGLIGGQRK